MDEINDLPTDEQPDLWLVDRLLDPQRQPVDPADRERVRMAAVVDALRQPGTPAELADEHTYLSAFDQVHTTERQPVRTIVIGTRAAIVAGIAVLAAATGAAAYTGSLPGPLQRAAHSTVGAPAADDGDSQGSEDPTESPTGSPTESPSQSPTESPSQSPTGSTASSGGVGPDATGPAAFGLCTAWSKGGLATTSVAYRNLSAAAGGADAIAAYCATVTKPGSSHTGGGSPTSHPHGSSTAHAPGSPNAHPQGSPTSHAKPAHPTGSPTSHGH